MYGKRCMVKSDFGIKDIYKRHKCVGADVVYVVCE